MTHTLNRLDMAAVPFIQGVTIDETIHIHITFMHMDKDKDTQTVQQNTD